MRDILFRGKRKDNNEWVEAFSILKIILDYETVYYVGGSKDALMEMDINYNLVSAKTLGDFLYYSVQPETIGQFTGLTDKNGKMIFEGDCIDHRLNVVEFVDGSFCVNGDRLISSNCEVIGNIHDNPDLMGGKDGK